MQFFCLGQKNVNILIFNPNFNSSVYECTINDVGHGCIIISIKHDLIHDP